MTAVSWNKNHLKQLEVRSFNGTINILDSNEKQAQWKKRKASNKINDFDTCAK